MVYSGLEKVSTKGDRIGVMVLNCPVPLWSHGPSRGSGPIVVPEAGVMWPKGSGHRAGVKNQGVMVTGR